MALLLASAVISIGSGNFPNAADAAPADKAMTASMVLHRAAIVYATAKTYRDTGVVKPESGSAAAFLSDVPFSTAYRAPDHFRFAYVSMHPKMTGAHAMRGIIYRIPALLMPRLVSGRKLTDDPGAHLMRGATCGAHACYRIREVRPRAEFTEIIWIDRTSFLVRRIDSKLMLRDGIALRFSTIYHPVLNAPVPDSALELGVPKSGVPKSGATPAARSAPARASVLAN